MASTFLDLLRAKVGIQLGLLTPAAAVGHLRRLDDGGADGGFLGLLRAHGAPADAVELVDATARRCLSMRHASVYLRCLRARSLVDEQALHPVMWEVRSDPSGPSLGEALVRRALLSPQAHAQVEAEARAALEREHQATTARYRERGYTGVEAPSEMIAQLIAEARGKAAAALTPASAAGRPAPVAAEPPPAALADAPSLPPALANTGLDEDYEILRKLGEGGMGVVYLARERKSERRTVALKVVQDSAKSKDAAERFKREILATSMCAHENIIEIYDAKETKDGSYYMAMEYLEGEELSDILKRERRIALPRLVDLLAQVLAGMEAMHQADIIHRDIKPHNFRITRGPDGREHLKIVDFGIARILGMDDAGLGEQIFTTMAGKITGSPAYIAPESITGSEVDGRADLYSLGISIFRLATGRLPFVAREPSEYLPMHLYNKPPSLRSVLPEAPQELEDFVQKLLAKLPADRFQSAAEALEVLERVVRPAVCGGAPAGETSRSGWEDETLVASPPTVPPHSANPSGDGPPALDFADQVTLPPTAVTAADLGFTQDAQVEEFDPAAQEAIAAYRAQHAGEGAGDDFAVGETTAEVEGEGPTGRVAQRKGFFARLWATLFGR
ncbi:MAG: serine/threonine protein kinase [Planctomycetota bacterium]|nr:MAG: serine/threonine protein kinase [Planctomycetota bacterium]